MTNSKWVPEVGERCLMQSPILGMWANKWLEVEAIVHKGDIVVGWCEDKQIAVWSGKYACKPLPTEEDRAVEEMMSDLDGHLASSHACRALYRAGYRNQPQPAEDMSDPANWRAGDMVVAIYSGLDITKGHFYSLFMDQYNELVFLDDVDDERQAKHHAHLVTFHQRP